MRCSQSRCRCLCHRSRAKQHQTPSPGDPQCSEASWHASPSPSLLHPQCEDEQLHHSFSTLHLQPQQQASQEREVDPVHLGIAPTSTAGHLGFLPRSTLKCLPPNPAPKQVQFDLADDLGDTLQLPADLASFLGEGATNVCSNALCLPAPSVTSTPMLLKRDKDQSCSTSNGGAWPWASTSPLTRPAAAGRTQPR